MLDWGFDAEGIILLCLHLNHVEAFLVVMRFYNRRLADRLGLLSQKKNCCTCVCVGGGEGGGGGGLGGGRGWEMGACMHSGCACACM